MHPNFSPVRRKFELVVDKRGNKNDIFGRSSIVPTTNRTTSPRASTGLKQITLYNSPHPWISYLVLVDWMMMLMMW